jgi:AcrR family transcriptional regulator
MSQESRQEIMEATYKALCKHGYADLSIQKIGNEFEKGKSLIYYHYDDKEDLMLAFLEYMEKHIVENHDNLKGAAPEKRLDELLDMTLGVEDDEMWEFHKAFLEVRAQAPKNQVFAEKFKQIDDLITENLTEILVKLDVKEPEVMADIIVSCIEGTVMRKVSTDDREGLQNLKNSIKGIVDQHIVVGCENCECHKN